MVGSAIEHSGRQRKNVLFDPELCCGSGICAAACPTAAITVGEGVLTDQSLYILCYACVKGCPTGARVMEHPRILETTAWLHNSCRERKEPEIYL
jgi:ferredoxin